MALVIIFISFLVIISPVFAKPKELTEDEEEELRRRMFK